MQIVNDNDLLRQDMGVTNRFGECVGEEVFQFSFSIQYFQYSVNPGRERLSALSLSTEVKNGAN